MNRYLVINKKIVVDIVVCEEYFSDNLTDKEFDTIQLDNKNTHNIGDIFE